MQELRGFLSIENVENRRDGQGSHVKKIKIITKLFENKHFIILKYGKNIIDAKDAFNKINYRYALGETWFISLNGQDNIYSLSFRLFNWINYRNMLFEDGIDKAFKNECLKNKCGSLVIVHNGETTDHAAHRMSGMSYPLFHFKTSCSLKMNAMNETLKSNLCRLIFNKEKI